ncbi:MAG TPA: hypothetical protein PLE71_17785 [Flavobacteriales bacterium]|nr:hypothetical protein [Flavobacteriales bacterium]
MVNAIRGTARGGYDTLVDHFDATQLVDSLIVRNFVLTKAKPKFTIIYQYNEHGGATGIPVDTIWLDENGNIDLRPNKEH